MSRRSTAFRVLFGDRVGLLVFLGAALVSGFGWQVGFFITDSYAVANGLVNVAAGHLEITRIQYALTFQAQPGVHTSGGQVYARNYGQIVAAVPILWSLELLSLVSDLSVLLSAAVGLGVLAVGLQAGVVFDRPTEGRLAGSVCALAVFALCVSGAVRIDDGWLAVLALQLLGVLAGSTVALLTYRLIARYQGRRVGAAAGAAVVLATPVAFWTTIPKRHVLTAALAMAVLWVFAISRDTDAVRYRVLGYVVVAFATWVHALEGFLLFAAFAPLDVATARTNRVRQLAVLGVVFVLAMGPFFLTNVAMDGNPLTPPRLVESDFENIAVGPGGSVSGPTTTTASGTATSTGTTAVTASETTASAPQPKETTPATPPDDATGGSPLAWLGTVLAVLGRGLGYVVQGPLVAIEDPGRVYHTFVRSGYLESVASQYDLSAHERIDLTVLESAPILGSLVVAPVLAARSFRGHLQDVGRLRDLLPRTERRQTDLLALSIGALFAVAYMPLLPLVSQITVRYLLPLYPLGLYAVARLPAVGSVVENCPRWLAGGYAATTGLGGLVLFGVLTSLDPAVGEAMQFHALVALATALVAALAVTARSVDASVDARLVAIALALPAGATTVLVALMRVNYFEYGRFVVPLARWAAELLAVVP